MIRAMRAIVITVAAICLSAGHQVQAQDPASARPEGRGPSGVAVRVPSATGPDGGQVVKWRPGLQTRQTWPGCGDQSALTIQDSWARYAGSEDPASIVTEMPGPWAALNTYEARGQRTENPSEQGSHVLVIVGLSGDHENAERFHRWAVAIADAA